jgi:Chaperone of endosialidase
VAFDGAGTFLRLYSWVVDATNSVKIRADRHDNEDNNFADGLSHCITKDGQTAITQNIPFNSRRIVSLADPIDPQDAATKDYADTKIAKTGDGTITGKLTVTGDLDVGGNASAHGYKTRQGTAGPYGTNFFNFDWTGGNVEAWIDTTKVGVLATKAYADTKLPLTGGTLTGNLTINGNTTSTTFAARSVGSSAALGFYDSGGVQKAVIFWNPADNSAAFMHQSGPVGVAITANGVVSVGNGWRSKGGFSGAYGTVSSNLYWEPGVGFHLYADDMHQGVIAYTSDYRLKKNVTELPGTWDIVKALRPVKYTQAAYGKTQDGADMFTADDIERWGFIAHELQETMIRTAATGLKDQANLVQSPNPWTIIAALTKTVQELQSRVEVLEAGQGRA